MSKIITNICRVDSAIVDQFANLGVATVHEALRQLEGNETGLMASYWLMAPYMRPIFRPAHIAGTAITCEVPPGDNWMIHVAVEQCQAGDILVVSPTESSVDEVASDSGDCAYLGDLLATSLMARGVRGVIIDGGVRDVAALTQMGFPVWSKSICAKGPIKSSLGNVNIPLECASATVNPGDLIVADDDGVVVVARESASDVLEKSIAREASEQARRERFAAGELGLDVYNMRDALVEKGLKYFEEPD